MIAKTDNVKHQTMILAIYASGLRLSELLNLKMTDIHWERKQLWVRNGKGKKDRVVMLSEVWQKILLKYCHMYKPIYYLFE